MSAAGFAENISGSILVTASETSSVNVTVTVAGMKQSTEVEDSAEITALESSTLGGLVNGTAIQSLPLSSRNYTQTLGLMPGVMVDLPVAAALGRGTQNVASNGATPTNNNIQFNGIDANNLIQNSATNTESSFVGTAIPSPDSIQRVSCADGKLRRCSLRPWDGRECQISSARPGRTGFHGSAWEFVRNNVFNANDFFSA